MIKSDTTFDVVFLYFGEQEDIPDQDGYLKILTCLGCIILFGLGTDAGMKDIKAYQAAQWSFEKYFVRFRIPKVILMDADGFFSRMFKKTFQEILLITVHAVTRGNHKKIRN